VSALACLRGSALLLRQRPLLMGSLGLAVVLGLIAACCGVGALIAPLFLCELLALQMAHARALGRDAQAPASEPVASVVRHRGWVAACVVLLGAVALTASVGWLVALGLGTEIIDDSAAWPGPAWLLVPASALIALVFVLPFLYAPLLLIEQASTLPAALLESARIVYAAGALGQLALSFFANFVQVSPLVLGSLLAHVLIGPQQGSLWALLGLPLMALTVPLGQGMITWSFAQCSPQAHQPIKRVPLLPRARLAMLLWSLILVAPVIAFGTLGASLVRPSRIPEGALTPDMEPMGTLETNGKTETIGMVIPATALTVRADRGRVRVEASDGGGAGRLPLRSRAPIERVRVGRTRDRYAIAVEQGALRSITFVDRAGVRLDDDLRARLTDRVDQLDLALMVLALILTAAAQLPLLAAAGRMLGSHQPGDAASDAALARGANRLLVVGLGLAPLAAWSVWAAVRALLGLP
jgi:hypothetical protein